MFFLPLSFEGGGGGGETLSLCGPIYWEASKGVVCQVCGSLWVSNLSIIRSKLGFMSLIVILTFKLKTLRNDLFIFKTHTRVINGLYKKAY